MLDLKKKKVFTRSNLEKFGFCYYKKKKVLILKSTNKKEVFFFIPETLNLKIQANDFQFNYQIKSSDISKFFFNVERYLNQKKERKKLYLKGLGFRINLTENGSLLTLKLGFSHLIYLKIPKDRLNIVLSKKSLSVEGEDKVLVGNFIAKIRALKKPDAYKGKGFFYKYQKEKLKIIKKK